MACSEAEEGTQLAALTLKASRQALCRQERQERPAPEASQRRGDLAPTASLRPDCCRLLLRHPCCFRPALLQLAAAQTSGSLAGTSRTARARRWLLRSCQQPQPPPSTAAAAAAATLATLGTGPGASQRTSCPLMTAATTACCRCLPAPPPAADRKAQVSSSYGASMANSEECRDIIPPSSMHWYMHWGMQHEDSKGPD